MNNKGIWPIGGILLVAIVGSFFVAVSKMSLNKQEAKTSTECPVAVIEVK